jgi:ABC-type branched-subunit amino acid transport system substrate-binding protein
MEESTVDASSYFILPGHLRDWILVYDELFKQLNLKSLSILRFSSGFGATLSKVLQDLLKTSHPNTQFAGAIEYQDIAMAEAATLLLKIKQINPAGLYIDAQPTGIANFIRKLNQQGAYGFTIFSNSIVEDLLVQKLVDPNMLEGVYFSKRKIFSGRFIEEYRALYKREPRLSADLGYYALLIALKAYASGDLLKSLTTDKYIIDAQEFQFDTQRVLANSKQEIFQIKEGQIRPLLKE